MKDDLRDDGRGPRTSRRDLLRYAGIAGAAAALASCRTGDPARPETSSDAPTAGALPTDDVELRWLAGPNLKPFFDEWFGAYMTEHPNIKLIADLQPAPHNEILQLGFSNGNAHDIFGRPAGIPAIQMVREGWLAPLDEIIPDFDAWAAQLPPELVAAGTVEGKFYQVPVNRSTGIGTLTIYNRRMLNDAGYDPETQPMGYDEFRDAVAKITAAGSGDYYGFIFPAGNPNNLQTCVMQLANRAGAGGLHQRGNFDWSTGEFTMATEAHLEVIEMLTAMVNERQVLPGFTGLDMPDVLSAFSQGSAGIWIGPAWQVTEIVRSNPDLDFGVAAPIAPDPARAVPMTAEPRATVTYSAYAGSPNLAVCGDLFSYLASEEGNRAYFEVGHLTERPLYDGILEDIDLADVERAAAKARDENHRVGPDPQLRNQMAELALMEMELPQPNLGQQIQGIFAGELEARPVLQAVEDRMNKALDDAIVRARAGGADVDRSDWVFSDWDPMEDYPFENYDL